MRFPTARWFVFLLIVLLPAQAALAAGGALCSIAHRTHDTMASPHSGATHDAFSHDAMTNAQASDDADEQLPSGERSTCSACAPYSGSLALSGVPSLGPAAVTTTGDDFLPVLVVLRPTRSDGLERPPRTI